MRPQFLKLLLYGKMNQLKGGGNQSIDSDIEETQQDTEWPYREKTPPVNEARRQILSNIKKVVMLSRRARKSSNMKVKDKHK